MLVLPQTRLGSFCRLGFAIGVACATASAVAASAAAAPTVSLRLGTPVYIKSSDSITVRTQLRGISRHALEYRLNGEVIARTRQTRTVTTRRFPGSLAFAGAHRLTVVATFNLRGRERRRSASRVFNVKRAVPVVQAESAAPATPVPTVPTAPAGKPDKTAPSPPTGLALGTTQGSTAVLNWNPSTDNIAVAGYTIRVDGSVRGTTALPQFTIVGLECEWPHSVSVEAFDAAGNRTTSQSLAFESGSCPTPSGQPMPGGDLPGWKRVFAENFLVDAAKGSWGSDWDPTKIVYTGRRGTKWVTYPKNYYDTYDKRPYRSDEVLTVHDNVLDFHLREVDGVPAGANPSPLMPDGTQYQTYGRYSARMRVEDTDLSGYYVAWLLWPKNEADWESAESDFPEGSLVPGVPGVMGVSHFGPNKQQEVFVVPGIDVHDWHTYTQEWEPGVRRYYIDGVLVFTTTTAIYAGPQRWQLQTETKGNGGGNGHFYIDWAVVWSRVP